SFDSKALDSEIHASPHEPQSGCVNRGVDMRLFGKLILVLAATVLVISAAPAAKADQIVIVSSGFTLQNLGNDGTGVPGLDSLVGLSTETHNISDPGAFQYLLNPLTFTTGFTGANSGGPHAFTFSQLLTVNGQTQAFNIVGRIDIDHLVDTVHILSATPLTFNFNTFSVAIDVIPVSIAV